MIRRPVATPEHRVPLDQREQQISDSLEAIYAAVTETPKWGEKSAALIDRAGLGDLRHLPDTVKSGLEAHRAGKLRDQAARDRGAARRIGARGEAVRDRQHGVEAFFANEDLAGIQEAIDREPSDRNVAVGRLLSEADMKGDMANTHLDRRVAIAERIVDSNGIDAEGMEERENACSEARDRVMNELSNLRGIRKYLNDNVRILEIEVHDAPPDTPTQLKFQQLYDKFKAALDNLDDTIKIAQKALEDETSKLAMWRTRRLALQREMRVWSRRTY